MPYSNHSKFVYINKDSIQKNINSGALDAYDFVICKDTHEFLMITRDMNLLSINSKVYRYLDNESAEKELNENSDTYEGQIVAVASKRGTYEAYIVNKNSQGKFYTTPLNAYSGEVDYNNLQHRPIENLNGIISSPIVIDSQKDGIYKVNGSYKISENLETIFSSVNNNLFIVSHQNNVVRIKKISADEIVDYVIDNGTVTSYVVPTTEWLESQGYITEHEVDLKLEALDFITKQEVEGYIQEILNSSLDQIIDQKIDSKINDRFIATTEREIVDIFTK